MKQNPTSDFQRCTIDSAILNAIGLVTIKDLEIDE